MFEFNIPAAESHDGFYNNILGMLNFLSTEILGPLGAEFAFGTNRFNFPIKALTHPLAQVIGCKPDFNAYLPKFQQIRAPLAIETLGTRRFCGGHIHVQYNHNNVPRPIFCKLMDLVVSLPFLSLDKQEDRREFYGKAGTFRPTDYGIEYRTPSNFWLDPKYNNSKFISLLASNVLALATCANEEPDSLVTLFKSVPWLEVQKAIDKEDIKLASEVLRHVHKYTPFSYFSSTSSKFHSGPPVG